MLRTDLAAAIDPSILGIVQPGVPYPIYPHRFLSNPTIFNPSSPALQETIALAAQSQIADFCFPEHTECKRRSAIQSAFVSAAESAAVRFELSADSAVITF